MKRCIVLLLPALLLLASCGSFLQVSQQQYQDGIYYSSADGRAETPMQSRTHLYSKADFKAMAAENIARSGKDTLDLSRITDSANKNNTAITFNFVPFFGLAWGFMGPFYDPFCRPWHYSPFYRPWHYGWSYYDPFCYDPFYGPWHYSPFYSPWHYGWLYYDPFYGPWHYSPYRFWPAGGFGPVIERNVSYGPRRNVQAVSGGPSRGMGVRPLSGSGSYGNLRPSSGNRPVIRGGRSNNTTPERGQGNYNYSRGSLNSATTNRSESETTINSREYTRNSMNNQSYIMPGRSSNVGGGSFGGGSFGGTGGGMRSGGGGNGGGGGRR